MDTPEDAFIACRADGTHLNGRALTVSVARSRVFPDVSPFSPHLSLASIAEPGHVARVDPTELQKELLAALDDETMAEIWFRDSLLNVSGDIARFEDVARAAAKDQMRVLVEILAQRPALLADLHPRLFEHLIAALLSASGYREVKLTVASADGGVDIYASKNVGLGKSVYLIQCKRYAPRRKKVTRPEVQMVYGVLASSSVTRGSIVTTSTFTKPATEFLDATAHRLSGVDGRDLQNWLRATDQALHSRGADLPHPR